MARFIKESDAFKDREVDLELKEEVAKMIEKYSSDPHLEQLHGANKEMQAICADLFDRKKKLRDCHIQHNFEIRKTDFAKVKKIRDGHTPKI